MKSLAPMIRSIMRTRSGNRRRVGSCTMVGAESRYRPRRVSSWQPLAARAMQSIGSGFCDQAELATGGMPIFGAELVRLQCELRHSIRNHRGIVAGDAEVVVIDPV